MWPSAYSYGVGVPKRGSFAAEYPACPYPCQRFPAGAGEAWIEGREREAVTLRKGDTMAIPPDTPHSFRVVGDQTLRLLGTHASPRRIVAYKDGAASDARGYRVIA